MASNGNARSRLLTAGGILSIIVGIYQIIGGLVLVGFFNGSLSFLAFLLTYFPFIYGQVTIGLLLSAHTGIRIGTSPVLLILICNVVLGIMAVVGGISAIRRKRFGLSLAGAICARPSVILGILAIIFVALGKREFDGVRD